MKLKVYWFLAAAVYFYAAFYVLWNYAPPEGDGYGLMPDLYLPGLKPSPVSMREYLNSTYIRFQYRVPYLVVAFAFTVLGGVIPSFSSRRLKLAKHPIGSSMAIAFVLLLVGQRLWTVGAGCICGKARTGSVGTN
jgi:hypothetical protein